MYDRSVALELPRNVSLVMYLVLDKLQNHSFRYNFQKFSFATRVVNVWNSLPDHVVDVNSLKEFETRLDKFWRDMFDWTAEITGTRDRSEFKLETVSESTVLFKVVTEDDLPCAASLAGIQPVRPRAQQTSP